MMRLTSNENRILHFFLKYKQKFGIMKASREVLKGNRPASTWNAVHYNEAEKKLEVSNEIKDSYQS